MDTVLTQKIFRAMPIYTYICAKCNKKIELITHYSKYQKTIACNECGAECQRSLQDDLGSGFVKLSDHELKLGHLAQRNSERFSDDYKAELKRKHNEYKEQEPSKPLPKGMSRVQRQPKIKWTKD